MVDTNPGRTRLAYLVMLAAPLFFSTNLVFGRGVIEEVPPFTLAFLRWVAVAAALLPFMLWEAAGLKSLFRQEWPLILVLAFLGMWICGAGVYVALAETSATNGTLIYTTSPILILLIEAAFRGRPIGFREGLGTVVAFAGVATIVLRGEPEALLTLRFNGGDLIFLGAALSWAIYSVLIRSPNLQRVSNVTLLGILAGAGAAMLVPFAGYEWLSGERMPMTARALGGLSGIVIFASLLAFSSFQFGIRHLGASLAGVFMYLLPPYGVLLAVLVLGEDLLPFHLAGIALVMAGVILATFPVDRLRRGSGG